MISLLTILIDLQEKIRKWRMMRESIEVSNMKIPHKRSRKCRYEEVYEEEAPKASVPVTGDILDELDDYDMMEPKEPPRMIVSHREKLAWSREVFQDTERYGSPKVKAFLQLCGFDV